MILSGKEPSEEVLKKCGESIKKLRLKPVLGIVSVGSDKASEIYVSRKKTYGEKIGIEVRIYKMAENVSQQEVIKLVNKLNDDKEVSGFIVQLPLPRHINENAVIEAIDPKKDVDGLHPLNMGKLFLDIMDVKVFLPATPYGIMKLIEYYKVPLEGKKAVVIGRSKIVGKPIAALLVHKNATVTICHSRTKDLKKNTENADIIVVAVGKPDLINGSMVKKGAYIFDVGMNRIGDKVIGDVNFESVKLRGAHCSPVPGGVGLMTVAMLMSNVVKAAELSK